MRYQVALQKAKGAFVSESALHISDGDKPNSVPALCWQSAGDDHLSLPDFSGSPADFHSPWCDDTRGFSGPAALPLFCLAPHGVFRASRITSRAVSSYLAFSPLPVLFSKNRRCLFCDTFRQRLRSLTSPAYFTRHAAVWCSDFPPVSRKRLTSDHLPSAINLSQSAKKKREPTDCADMTDKTVFTNFSRSQNGAGTARRKIVIIATAMTSSPIIAPRFPSKLPQPARPASIIRLPAMNSLATAPITGPTNKPMIPKKTPMSAPTIAPNAPHLVAPKYFAPK